MGVNYDKRMRDLNKEAKRLEVYMSDEEDVQHTQEDLEKDDEIQFCKDFSNCIIVDNIPVIPEAKYEKLCNVVKKVFSQVGEIFDFNMPMNSETGKTSGCAFIEYETEEEVTKAVQNIDNFALDKNHTLRVNRYADFQKYLATPDKYIPLEKPEYVERPDLMKWLSDESGRDMFCLRYGSETEIFWSDHGDAKLVYGGEREKENGKQWCSQYVTWSPQGTYLATFHPQGIALWGGENYEKLGRFSHRNVKLAVFSPLENYLITCNDSEKDDGIIFWDVRTGKMLRSFPSCGGVNAIPGVVTPFRWCHNDKYVARRGKDVISIYETPSMKLLGNKSLKADGVHDFYWSPTDNYIAYWAPESANVPARVSLVEIPTRLEVRQKNLFNVSDCKLHWHDGGSFLCVNVTRHSKSKKTRYTNFELFRLRESLVPVEMLEMKERVVAFAWEPKGSRFAVCHGEENQRLNVSFYDMMAGKNNNELTLMYTLNDKECNRLYWSPQGNYIVLAGLGDQQGKLEFWDTDEKQTLSMQEHFKCSSVDWDPSGRVVATAVSQSIENPYYKFQMDNGYCLWTFQGLQLTNVKKEEFYQFLWRPRPQSLLSDEEYRDVVRNLKKYERKFLDLDRKKEREKIAAAKAEKLRQLLEFKELLSQRQHQLQEQRKQVISIRDGYDSDDDQQYIINCYVKDEIVSQHEEIIRN